MTNPESAIKWQRQDSTLGLITKPVLITAMHFCLPANVPLNQVRACRSERQELKS